MTVARAIVHDGQPAAETRFDGVKVIADARLRDLFEDNVGVAQGDVVKLSAAAEQIADSEKTDVGQMYSTYILEF
jgi:hypothetical protein